MNNSDKTERRSIVKIEAEDAKFRGDILSGYSSIAEVIKKGNSGVLPELAVYIGGGGDTMPLQLTDNLYILDMAQVDDALLEKFLGVNSQELAGGKKLGGLFDRPKQRVAYDMFKHKSRDYYHRGYDGALQAQNDFIYRIISTLEFQGYKAETIEVSVVDRPDNGDETQTDKSSRLNLRFDLPDGKQVNFVGGCPVTHDSIGQARGEVRTILDTHKTSNTMMLRKAAHHSFLDTTGHDIILNDEEFTEDFRFFVSDQSDEYPEIEALNGYRKSSIDGIDQIPSEVRFGYGPMSEVEVYTLSQSD